MTTKSFSFPGHDGSTLSGRLDLPDGPTVATALFAHCFTCGKDIAAARRISARLAAMGIAVLRFDFTGLGQSKGQFAETTFTSNAQDLVFAARALTDAGMPPDLLIGHSLGGAAVIAASQDITSARAIVTIGAPFDPEHVTHNFGAALDQIETGGSAQVDLGGRPVTIGQSFVDDVRATSLASRLAKLGRALLVMHAPRDAIVGVENAAQIFQAARHPKSFVTLDDADHLLTHQQDADYAATVISAWVARYLELTEPARPIGAPEGIVRVSEADRNGFLQFINAGPHHQNVADEPLAYGGTNQGMSPYGYLAAGLGACTSMTIRMYARRKDWPLEHVYVDVTHDKVHAQDATLAGAKLDTFRRAIHLQGPLSEDQKSRLLEIADRCPVHKTLEQASVIETKLVNDG
jgi:putative redox protein